MAEIINVRRLISAGFALGQIGFNDSNGYQGGIAGSTAEGAVSPMKVIAGVKTANIQIPADALVSVTGDNTVLGTFEFTSNEPRSFEFTVGELDLDIANKSQGTSIYTEGIYYDFMLGDVPERDFLDGVTIFSSNAKIVELGNRSGFYHIVFPNSTMSYQGTSLNEQDEVVQNYRLTINPFRTTPWGRNVNDAFGKEEGHFLMIGTERRVTLNTYVHDGSSTEFLLSRVPFTSTTGIIRAFLMRNDPNGTTGINITSSVSVNASTRTVDISGVSPLNQGDYIVVWFEY